jgi:tetratricopeptide (TPR) repeat protein
VREIGARLGVATVLDGSVRKSGDRLRIGVQLARTDDGYQMWSRRFDRELKDVFAVQEEIAELVAHELRGVLTPEDRRALRRPAASDVAAYELYLRGRQLFYRSNRRDIEAARELFRAAIAIDAGFALAYSGLADCGGWLYNWWGGARQDFDEANEASARALELAPNLAEAHTARGEFEALNSRFTEAEARFEEALRLKPQLFEAFYYFARARYVQGDLVRAAELFERAAEVRREDYQCLLLVGTLYASLGRPAEQRDAMRRGLERARVHLAIEPGDVRAIYLAAGAFAQLGDQAEARVWLDRALEAEPDDPAVQYNVACVLANLGEHDRAIELLDKSLRNSWGQRSWIVHDPDLDPLRGDPRFQKLLERLR